MDVEGRETRQSQPVTSRSGVSAYLELAIAEPLQTRRGGVVLLPPLLLLVVVGRIPPALQPRKQLLPGADGTEALGLAHGLMGWIDTSVSTCDKQERGKCLQGPFHALGARGS